MILIEILLKMFFCIVPFFDYLLEWEKPKFFRYLMWWVVRLILWGIIYVAWYGWYLSKYVYN